jgi:DNA mismatch repair protein MutS2
MVRLVDARHPLLVRIAADRNKVDVENAGQYVVPVSPRIGGDLDLLLVTGPNAGGKTVLLKTVGICILLAQSGCHIPAAEGSQIGVYHQVFADIGDQHSIQDNLSTFSAHVKQVIRILANTRPGTLILLDELGAGTDPQEGAALAAAILDELLARSGHVIATTHMGQLKAYAFSRPRAENASLLFDTEHLQPTFKLLMGTPGSSNALAIAQRLGMPRKVTAKAKQTIGSQADHQARLINEVQKVRQLAEDRRAEAEKAVLQAIATRQQLEQQIEQLRQQEQLLQRQADLAIDQSLQQVKVLVDQFCKEIQNAPKPWPQQATGLADQIDAILRQSPLQVRHAQFIKDLRRGDSVYMIPFKTIATVDKVLYNRGTIVLLAGGKQIELGLDQVCRPEVARYL